MNFSSQIHKSVRHFFLDFIITEYYHAQISQYCDYVEDIIFRIYLFGLSGYKITYIIFILNLFGFPEKQSQPIRLTLADYKVAMKYV